MNLITITVIVEDKAFKTTKDTLLLSGFFRGMMEIEPDSIKFIVNDRSKKMFKHVLAYLRDNRYPFPLKYKSELDYYDIEYNEDTLYDSKKTFITELNKITDKLSKMEDELNTMKQRGYYVVPGKCNLCGQDVYKDERHDYSYCIDHVCDEGHCQYAKVNGTDYCINHTV